MLPKNCIYKQRFAFVPHRLDIEGRPELSDFPFNVLYVSWKRVNGVDVSGTAVYYPELDTYRLAVDARVMNYRNIYGRENLLVITKYADKWEGVKIINDKRVITAFGINWQQFFVQLTAFGLSDGEKCKFKREDLTQKN